MRNKQCSHLADSRIPDNEKVIIFTEVGEAYDELNWVKDKLQTIERDVFITADFKEVKKKLEEEKRAGKGAVIKYGTGGGGGRHLTGSPKLLDGKHWANKLLPSRNMGHEAICSRTCFNIFLTILNTVSVSFCCSLDH